MFHELRQYPQVKNDPIKLKILSYLMLHYVLERKSFIRYMERELKRSGKLPSSRQFEGCFNLNPSLITVEADKNLGYVCLDKSDLLAQYSLINEKEHFGKTAHQ